MKIICFRLISGIFCTLLLIMFSCKNRPPEDITDPGQLLYLGYVKKKVNCSKCHGPDGQGGLDAPDIRPAFKKFGEKKIVTFILEGKGKGKNAMPPFADEITSLELEQLMRFLETLKPLPDSLQPE